MNSAGCRYTWSRSSTNGTILIKFNDVHCCFSFKGLSKKAPTPPSCLDLTANEAIARLGVEGFDFASTKEGTFREVVSFSFSYDGKGLMYFESNNIDNHSFEINWTMEIMQFEIAPNFRL